MHYIPHFIDSSSPFGQSLNLSQTLSMVTHKDDVPQRYRPSEQDVVTGPRRGLHYMSFTSYCLFVYKTKD